MLLGMVVRAAPLLVLVCACSNDEFNGQDAAEEKPPEDTSVVDVAPEASVEAEAGPTGFCGTQSKAFFCDDFDELTPVAQSWSVTTPATPPAGSLDFGAGVASSKGATVKAPAATNVFLTKQVQGNVLHGFTFALQLSGPIGTTAYVRVQAGTSTFTLAADLTAANLTMSGDTGGAVSFAKADSSWHNFDVQLANGKANMLFDGTNAGSVPFAVATSNSSTFDIGVISSTLNVVGITVLIDNVALR
jgi:hypothetical protein